MAGTVYMTSFSIRRTDLGKTEWPKENGCTRLQWISKPLTELLILETNSDNHLYRFYPYFRTQEDARKLGFDKVIMQAGWNGLRKIRASNQKTPQTGDKIVILGGENYRIGMGGAAVSSADTGALALVSS
jgi:phosphoribosylformylglycinamidine synthase